MPYAWAKHWAAQAYCVTLEYVADAMWMLVSQLLLPKSHHHGSGAHMRATTAESIQAWTPQSFPA